MLELSLIGCGWAAQTHMNILNEMKDVRVRCVISQSKVNHARDFAKKYRIPIFGNDLNLALSDRKTNGFLVCVPPHKTYSVMKKILPLGLPILLEKPAGKNVEEIESLIKIPNSMKLVSVGFQLRSGKPFKEVQNLLLRKELGTIIHAYHRMHFPGHSPSYARGWSWDPRCAIGVLKESGCHGVDIFLNLFGPPVSCSCKYSTLQGVVVAGTIILKHEEGVISTVDVSYLGYFNQVSGLLEIHGTKGWFCLDRGTYINRNARIIKEIDDKTEIVNCDDVGFKEQLNKFISSLTCGHFSQLPTLLDARNALQVITAAQQGINYEK